MRSWCGAHYRNFVPLGVRSIVANQALRYHLGGWPFCARSGDRSRPEPPILLQKLAIADGRSAISLSLALLAHQMGETFFTFGLNQSEPSLDPFINGVQDTEEHTINGLIYLVGLVVVVGIILSFFGLR